VIYDVSHVTRYVYGAIVELTTGVLRLTPASGGGQIVERFSLVTDPPSLPPSERIDPFGNRVTRLMIERPFRQLSIAAKSRIQVDRPSAPANSPVWESVAAEALTVPTLDGASPAVALFPSRRVALFEAATAYARESFPIGRAVHEAALELCQRIHADFVYDSGATKVNTTPSQAFAQRRGVCQDFAHIMIAALRGLGLPALYVSGYIRTRVSEGEERLMGADASHAWVSLWRGAALGWGDYDPTNALAVRNDHIVVARGRDYSDASPVESMIVSSGSHRLEVEVDVAPVMSET
jgi:transglutaminase-like putative cysteine protease